MAYTFLTPFADVEGPGAEVLGRSAVAGLSNPRCRHRACQPKMLSVDFSTQDALTGLSNPGCCKPSCSDSLVPACPGDLAIAGLVPNRTGVFTPDVLSLDAVLSGLSNPDALAAWHTGLSNPV